MRHLIALLIVPFLAPAAHAQPQPCAPFEPLAKTLADRYGETQQSGGMAEAAGQPNALMLVFANEDTGTWSLLRVTPDGTACLIASGQDWQDWQTDAKPGDPA